MPTCSHAYQTNVHACILVLQRVCVCPSTPCVLVRMHANALACKHPHTQRIHTHTLPQRVKPHTHTLLSTQQRPFHTRQRPPHTPLYPPRPASPATHAQPRVMVLDDNTATATAIWRRGRGSTCHHALHRRLPCVCVCVSESARMRMRAATSSQYSSTSAQRPMTSY